MCVTRVIVHVCACVMYVCLIWMCDVCVPYMDV